MTSRSSRTSSGVLAALVLLAVVAAAAAALAPAAAAAAPKPFAICIDVGGQAGPDIAGNMVVWTDNRNGNLDIYGRDLGRHRNVAVCTNKTQQDNPSVASVVTPSGKVQYVAVWVDKRNHPSSDASDIYGRNITTRTNFLVSRNATIKWYPQIVDHWVTWIEADDSAGPYRVKARDLDTATTYLVATTKVLSPPDVDWRQIGAKIVFTSVYTSGNGNISGRNLPDGAPFNVSQRSTFEWLPDISHNRVVWWESGGRIMMKDLKTGAKKFVASGSRPRIDGELVTWDGGGHGGTFVTTYVKGAEIYVRNAVRGAGVVAIAQQHLTCIFPAISGHTVVWESGPARRVLSHIHIYGARVR